jgi:hypothetical protein
VLGGSGPEGRLREAEAKLHRAQAMAAAAYGRLAEVVARNRGRDLPDPGLLDAARTYVVLRRALEQHREHIAALRDRLDAREAHFPCVRPGTGMGAAAG